MPQSYQTIIEKDGNFAVNLGYFPRENGNKRYKFYSVQVSVDDGIIVANKIYMAVQMFSRDRLYDTWSDMLNSKSCNMYFNMWDYENTFYLDNFKNADGTVWQPSSVECVVYAW